MAKAAVEMIDETRMKVRSDILGFFGECEDCWA